MVEGAHNLTRELEVAGLVHAHRHYVSFVQGDVSGHKHRIADQSVIDVVGLLAYFFFEGGQPGQLAQLGDHAENSVQLGHLRHVRLDKDDGAQVGVHAGCQPIEHHLIRPLL